MDIWQEALDVNEYVIRCRRHFHEYPELSDHEDETVEYILNELTSMGIRCEDVPAGGVMGFIDGARPGKTVLLRADIDALPMQEDPHNEKQPKVCVSKRDGIAHTCGHDTHTAMLLGAAKILHEHRNEIAGKIVLYFERGEEHGHGDYHMVKYLQDRSIHVDGCWAQHVRSTLPTGSMSIISGGVYAGTTAWNASICDDNGNALACAVAIINTINTARMRELSPFERMTITNTKLQYGTDRVTIPNTCQISGTCRFYDIDNAGKPMRDTIRKIIEETCAAYGCSLAKKLKKANLNRGVINDATCCALARDALGAVIGPENIMEHEPTMGGESFSILAAYYPSVIAFTGVGNEDKGMSATIHHPKFEPDEAALKTGVASTVAYALAFLAYDKPIPFRPFVGDIDAYIASNQN